MIVVQQKLQTTWSVASYFVSFFSQDGPVNCDRYLAWASAFLIVYSIDNRLSFEACQQYVEAVTLYTKGQQPEAPIILVGNKLDMERYRYISTHCFFCMLKV